MKFKVYSLDVWGNDKGRNGYTVNDCMDTGITVSIPDGMNYRNGFDSVMVKALKHSGMIKKHVHTKSIDIDGDIEFTIYINDAKDLYPLYELRRIK